MRNQALFAAVALSVIGCGDNVEPPASRTAPDAPAINDTAYTITGLHHWYLIGNPATPGDDTLSVSIDAPSGTGAIDVWIGAGEPHRLHEQAGVFTLQLPIAEMPAGTQSIVFSSDGGATAFAGSTISRSAPYYVLVSTDWDFSDPGVGSINDIDALHAHHPIHMTDFVGPYTFTDPAVTPARRTELAQWLVKQRDTNGDEIGLHIHPYCNFVTDAGLPCVTDRSTVYAEDTTGYTIELDAYSRDDTHTLLDHAADLFDANGLGRPTVFRAGGWTLGIENALALEDKGYVADSSAINWERLTSWLGHLLYTWNEQHWGPIGDTSQPYYPTVSSTLGNDGAPPLGLLEVPDNGIMIDYVTLPQMTGIFDSNWNGAPLDHPITLMMGFHPSVNYTSFEEARVDGFLTYADKHLATADLGPVVYTTLTNVLPAFPPE